MDNSNALILSGLITKTGSIRVNLHIYDQLTDRINQEKIDQAINYLMAAERVLKEINGGQR
jgi:hypothetical protein